MRRRFVPTGTYIPRGRRARNASGIGRPDVKPRDLGLKRLQTVQPPRFCPVNVPFRRLSVSHVRFIIPSLS